MYRSPHLSFWHDNPDDAGMREKYQRRIERFKQIDAKSQPVLFVRAVASTNELLIVEELVKELTERFGCQAYLLLILDYQRNVHGPAFVRNVKGNLLLYFHKEQDRVPESSPYIKPVKDALLWAKGEKVDAKEFESISDVVTATDQTHWGYTASGSIRAFEDQVQVPTTFAAPSAAPLSKC
jgi:hypothetical protein